MNEYAKPLPQIDPRQAPFWRGLRERQILLPTCSDCAKARFPATRFCGYCWSEAMQWVPVAGGATLQAYATFHKAYWAGFAADVPYQVIQVRLDAGVSLFSNRVGPWSPRVQLGARLKPYFDDVTPSVTLLKFSLDEAQP